MKVGDKFVVTAFAEPASGPGWANSPIRVVVQEAGTGIGSIAYRWLQPDEQSEKMRTLYRISAEVNRLMSVEAARILGLHVAD